MKSLTIQMKILLYGFVFMIFCGVQLNAQEVTLMASDDAVAWSEFPDQTATTPDAIGGGNILADKYQVDEVDHHIHAYVKFDVSQFANRMISNASFSTRGTAAAETAPVLRLRKSGTAFSRETTNWDNKPSASGELALKTYDNSSARRPYEQVGTALVDYINEELAKGVTEIAFSIQYKEGDMDAMSWIGGMGDGSYGPMLMLEFDKGLTFFGTDDAVAWSDQPDLTAADSDLGGGNIFVNKVDDDTQAVSYVKFHLPGFANKAISSASFSTRGTSATDLEQTVQLRKTGTAFTRDTTNWNNKPGMSGKLATKTYINSSARVAYEEIGDELVDYINAELAKGNETIAFGLQFDAGDLDAGNWIGGTGDGAYGPILEVVPDNSTFSSFALNDAVVFEHEPDETASFFHPTNLLVEETETETTISFVQFDISEFSGRVVDEVNFSTRSGMASGTTMTVKLTEAGNAFHRDTTTWNNKPSTGNELASVVYDDQSARKVFEPNENALVDYVNSKLKAGAEVVSFAIEYKDGEGGDLNWIGGKGDGAYGPQLEMSFDYGYNGFGVDDAVVFEHDPDETAEIFHPSNLMIEDTETTQTISFVKFNVADIAGMEIVDAAFSTRGPMSSGNEMTIKLTEAGSDFTRSETTWNTMPSYSDELATVLLDDNSARKVYENNGANLVDYINQHTLMGAEEVAFGLVYKEGAGGELSWMGGVGDGSYGPQLELTLRRPQEVDTIYVIADAYVSEENATDNFGDQADMGIRKSGDGTDMETFVKFDISELADAVVGKVSFTAYIGQHDSGTEQDDFFVDVYAVEDDTWAEMDVNWDTKPEAGMKLIEENVTWFGAGQDVVWSSHAITHYINEAVAEGKSTVSFVLKGKDDTPGNRLWMAGREWKPMATRLILDYLTPPPAQQSPVVADAYVSQVDGENDQNYGDQADQHLVNDDANDASKWIFFKYDISGAYQETVSSSLVAYGSIHNESSDLEELNFGIYPADNVEWEEMDITWDTKPSVENNMLLSGTLLQGGRWMNLTSAAFTDYINSAVDAGKDYVTLVAKALDETPGQRGWISGREWNASYVHMNYEPEVALPKIAPNAGEYISEVEVSITTSTADADIYYTLDNTTPDEENGTLYDAPFTLEAIDQVENFNVQAIAYAPELNPSGVVSAAYTIAPVGNPVFTPTPDVSYQQSVLVSISVEPEGSVIRYSDDGSAPTTLYSEPILLTEATTLKAQAYNADFSFSTDIVEVTYDVVETEPAPGVGPAGVGFADLSRENQPAIGLWLRAHDLEVADGEKVNVWADQSGNENHATNDESLVEEPIENTGESWKEAPVFTANGLNDWPTVHFGTQIGGDNPDVKNLVVPDDDNLDGSAGLSIFLVMKRNQMHDDFAAIFQKRDVRNQPAQSSYVLEMDGGANPNKMQFVIARDIFLKSQDEFNDQDFYIINTAMNSKHQLASFMTNGELKSSALYQKVIQNTHAPVIIGGFQPVDIAEVVLFNSDVNSAQTVLVENYLAAKYNLSLVEGRLYNNEVYVHDIIGVGTTLDIAGEETEQHNFSAGGGLQIFTTGLANDGDFVIAGHNGAAINDDNSEQAWMRYWNVETAGNGGDVSLRFDFDTEGVTNDPNTDYSLWYKTDETADWTNLELTPVLNERVLSFGVEDIQDGIYAVGVSAPGSVNTPEELTAENDGFHVYPNPAHDQLMVDMENTFNGKVEIRILDMYGRVIASEMIQKDASNMLHSLDLNGLKTGTYFVEVKDASQRSMKLFMVR